jgi:hypothetical protein
MAVADGATETSFAALWAKLLVRSYGKYGPPLDPLDSDLTRIRAIWRKCVHRRPLPWYAEAKAEMGAFSSLLGLTISKDDAAGASSGKWTAHAVGDSCLFHIRGDECLEAFPLEKSEEFSSRPALLSSTAGSASSHCPSLRKEGFWQQGDVFYLMTDALACWFLTKWERDERPLELLRKVQQQEAFTGLIISQRNVPPEDGTPLRNDDVTMIFCEMTSDESPPRLP